jgi:hypothetical protein
VDAGKHVSAWSCSSSSPAAVGLSAHHSRSLSLSGLWHLVTYLLHVTCFSYYTLSRSRHISPLHSGVDITSTLFCALVAAKPKISDAQPTRGTRCSHPYGEIAAALQLERTHEAWPSTPPAIACSSRACFATPAGHIVHIGT